MGNDLLIATNPVTKGSLFNLKFIRKRQLSELERGIMDTISRGLQHSTPESLAEAARELDRACPPVADWDKAGDYVWAVWDLILDIARSPEATREIHTALVRLIEDLRLCAKGELKLPERTERLWRDLPMWPVCMDVSFDDPISGETKFNEESAKGWRNMNSFAALCLEAGIAGPYLQAMYALLFALEGELDTLPDMAMKECGILVACTWMAHGAKDLLLWARQNLGYMDVPVEDSANYIERGPLYKGPETMCPQRWSFWLSAFQELAEDAGMSEEVRKAASEAAETMMAVEGRYAHTLAG